MTTSAHPAIRRRLARRALARRRAQREASPGRDEVQLVTVRYGVAVLVRVAVPAVERRARRA